jgi:hypothetical protein
MYQSRTSSGDSSLSAKMGCSCHDQRSAAHPKLCQNMQAGNWSQCGESVRTRASRGGTGPLALRVYLGRCVFGCRLNGERSSVIDVRKQQKINLELDRHRAHDRDLPTTKFMKLIIANFREQSPRKTAVAHQATRKLRRLASSSAGTSGRTPVESTSKRVSTSHSCMHITPMHVVAMQPGSSAKQTSQ